MICLFTKRNENLDNEIEKKVAEQTKLLCFKCNDLEQQVINYKTKHSNEISILKSKFTKNIKNLELKYKNTINSIQTKGKHFSYINGSLNTCNCGHFSYQRVLKPL